MKGKRTHELFRYPSQARQKIQLMRERSLIIKIISLLLLYLKQQKKESVSIYHHYICFPKPYMGLSATQMQHKCNTNAYSRVSFKTLNLNFELNSCHHLHSVQRRSNHYLPAHGISCNIPFTLFYNRHLPNLLVAER